jgi:hypothetical protein
MGGRAQVDFAVSTDAEVRFSGHEWVSVGRYSMGARHLK